MTHCYFCIIFLSKWYIFKKLILKYQRKSTVQPWNFLWALVSPSQVHNSQKGKKTIFTSSHLVFVSDEHVRICVPCFPLEHHVHLKMVYSVCSYGLRVRSKYCKVWCSLYCTVNGRILYSDWSWTFDPYISRTRIFPDLRMVFRNTTF